MREGRRKKRRKRGEKVREERRKERREGERRRVKEQWLPRTMDKKGGRYREEK